MKAGYAQTIITPGLEKTVYMAGFGQNRRAETVHDDLYVRALALADSSRTLILCGLDLIGFFRRDVNEVIKRVHETAPGVDVIMASLHPHHGPDTMGLWGPNPYTSGIDQGYLSSVKDKATATILSAIRDLKPVSGMKTTSLLVPGLAKNARNPEVRDEELTVAQFMDKDGHALVSLFNFPCHPEVLWEHNTHISADYPGSLRREVESLTGAPCIFFSGALGGMMTPDVKDHSFEEAGFMGRKLAVEGLKALKDAPVLQEGLDLSRTKQEFGIKLTNPLFKIAIHNKLFPDVRSENGLVNTEASLLKIGSLWFATIPGELLPKLGLSLKADMKSAGAGVAGVICLANDELGYIIPEEIFRFPLNPLKPGKHYEETNSIGKGIAPAVMKAVRSLLNEKQG